MISNSIRLLLRALAALALLLASMSTSLPIAEQATGPDSARSAPNLATAAHFTPEQAIAVAVNDLEAIADGYRLRHPRHVATFTPDGLLFTPQHGGPEWAWQLTAVGAGDVPLAGVEIGAVRPTSEQSGAVAYERGGLVEQYLPQQDSVEQQFVIPEGLGLDGADLVVVGAVRSAGTFEETEDGWRWRTSEGAVRLGDVRAYDAAGRDLPATMAVTASETRIVVDGEALACAAYPVTIDPEIGANDFRLSDMGGDALFDANSPAVAYNSTDDEYLVVWHGDDNTGALVDNETEIFGQRVDAATGAEIGADFRLSDMGPDGDADYDALNPAVAYNSTANEYLVVWQGDDDTDFGGGPLADGEFEIFGQRVDADGSEIGTDRRLSDMGSVDGIVNYCAYTPDVAYNSTEDQYLVVWQGDDDTDFGSGPLADNEYEIFGQLVNADGTQDGGDFRLSDMGQTDGIVNYGAASPAVAYNSTANEYLVVWFGDDDTDFGGGPLADGEFEIFGQRVKADGSEIGPDRRLSDMGSVDGIVNYSARFPAVAYNSTDNQYLVVWFGDDDTDFGNGPLADNEYEIFGQLVNADGTQDGTNDFRLSDMGPDGDAFYGALFPAVAYNSTTNGYLVVWQGDDDTPPLVDNEREVFGQRVKADGTEDGGDFRLSDMGPDGDVNYDARNPAVAYNSTDDEYLVVWQGHDDIPPLVLGEGEIFGQRVKADGTETGTNDFRLSDMGGDALFDAVVPAVAYNSTEDQYLVVWCGDDDTDFGNGPLADNELEIFGQLVDAATGAEIGADFRLSDMGQTDGDANYGAASPAVAYNSTDNEYLVVWWGDDDTDFGGGPLANDEFEIFGQRVDADGSEIGTDRRLSNMGSVDGNANYDAGFPAVAYNSTDNQYLVVWWGDDNTGGLVDNEAEIFGQLVNANGTEDGGDFRLSHMGPDGDVNYAAGFPAVAYNSTEKEYLVVWWGDDNAGGLVDNEFEIFDQRVEAATGFIMGPRRRLSDMGPPADVNYGPFGVGSPDVAYNSTDNEYLVVWRSDDDTDFGNGPLADNEYEIFGQRVKADGTKTGTNDFRLSDMGPDGNVNYNAGFPAVAYNSTGNEYLVVWPGDDDTGPLVDDELEIFCQRVRADGTPTGANDLRLSDMGPDGDANYDAGAPAVAYNSTDDEYLVVWQGDDDIPPLVDEEFEIFGQRFALVADLSIAKSDSPDPVAPGATLTYTLSVNNAGPGTASSVTVTDSLPSAVTFVSASGTGWACSHASGVVACTVGSLAVGSAPDIVIAVTAPASGGTITNTATVASDTHDPNTANNTATTTTFVNYRVYLPLTLRNS